jgi:hypothetical protein
MQKARFGRAFCYLAAQKAAGSSLKAQTAFLTVLALAIFLDLALALALTAGLAAGAAGAAIGAPVCDAACAVVANANGMAKIAALARRERNFFMLEFQCVDGWVCSLSISLIAVSGGFYGRLFFNARVGGAVDCALPVIRSGLK